MRPVAPTLVSLLLVAAASVGAQRAGTPVPPTITITRRAAPAPPARATRDAAGSGNFTGSVRVEPVFQAIAPGRVSGSDVTFDAGARTAWHMHPAGQTLIVPSAIAAW